MIPYIYVSNDSNHTQEVWQNGEFQTHNIAGVHGIFAARIPFIPSFLSEDFTRMIADGSRRNELVMGRQIRFVNSLANAKLHEATFDLRFIATPSATKLGQATIDIILLGKVFHQQERLVRLKALELWRKIQAHFPSEDPYNYPLDPITCEQEFCQYFEPIPLSALQPDQLVEIRKYEDYDPYLGDQNFNGYYPHSFLPNIVFSALGSLMETLARQSEKCIVSVSLKPTNIYQGELLAIEQMLHTYSKMTEESEGWLELHRKERLDDLQRTYWPLINQRNHLFTIKVQIVSANAVPSEVIEALGAEFMDNTTREPRLWSLQRPGNQPQFKVALNNFRYLEHTIWGDKLNDKRVKRLRFLVTAYEATGAFRLPVPPESSYLPGVRVRDEAFFLPTGMTNKDTNSIHSSQEPRLKLGEIIHRGTHTGLPFTISLTELKRHALIAGATGSGKTNTCLNLLSQLWANYDIPFLVLYPIDKPDYRLLMADDGIREALLIFTLGDETTSPFRFNPFQVPKGILLKTHISQLMRCFTAAFSLWDPLPAVYREGLRHVYRKRGWNLITGKGGDPDVSEPTLQDFYESLVEVAEALTQDYGPEVRGNVRQGAEIRIRDLLHTAGSVINVQESVPFEAILSRPTVMELGRIGSSEDIALIMGFLLTTITETLQSLRKQPEKAARNKQHVTLIEEAHRLMSANDLAGASFQTTSKAKGAEDFSHILAEVRGFGEAILIAEQMPTSLITSAIGNTHNKIMHRLEDVQSFNLFSQILNLNERQKTYARAINVGQALVRSISGDPVHVQVTNYLDQFQHDNDEPIIDDSDAYVKKFMQGRIKIGGYKASSSLDLQPIPSSWQKPPWGNTCSYCHQRCNYGSEIAAIPNNVIAKDRKLLWPAFSSKDWLQVKKICFSRIDQLAINNLSTSDRLNAAYCYWARIVASPAEKGKTIEMAFPKLAQESLEHFHKNEIFEGGE